MSKYATPSILGNDSLIFFLVCLEIFARVTWDDRRGKPNFFTQHPTRGYVLTPNYDGFFEGHPAKINNFGFRDNQNYEIEKNDPSPYLQV